MAEPLPADDDIFGDVQAALQEVSNTGEGKSEPAPAPGASSENPSSGAVEQAPNRSRDEQGRFTSSPEGEKGEPQEDSQSQPELESPPLEATPTPGAPPPSWSVKSKATWEQLPEHVRADILKRESEVNNGFAVLRDYRDLKPYAEMAKQHGTTIKEALDNYVGIENLLRRDMGAGLRQICQNFGLDQQQTASLFSQLAGGAQPAANQTAVQGDDQLAALLQPFLTPLTQELATLRQQVSERETAHRTAEERTLMQAIDAFAANPANRYYPELQDTMVRMFETGFIPLTGNHTADLKAAYDAAANLVPEVREALIEQRIQTSRQTGQVEKAKAASKSMSGTIVPSPVVKSPRDDTRLPNLHDDVEADVRAAMRLSSMG